MSEPAASPPPPPPAEGWLAAPRSAEGWSRNKFVFFIAIAFALHVALIFIFGTKKQIVPRAAAGAAANVPHLRLVANTDPLIALGDPTLFARPSAHDLAAAFWRRPAIVPLPNFNWTEAPRYLAAPEDLGGALRQFLRANPPPVFSLNLKPAPKLIEPAGGIAEAMPQMTTMQVSGALARRKLLTPFEPPTLALNGVLAPSHAQVLVDAAGNVFSAVLLPPDGAMADASRSDKADAAALTFVQSLRFAPAPQPTFGEITFRWHTVPVTSTNTP